MDTMYPAAAVSGNAPEGHKAHAAQPLLVAELLSDAVREISCSGYHCKVLLGSSPGSNSPYLPTPLPQGG